MSDQHITEIFYVFRREVRKYLSVDFVVAEGLFICFKTQRPKPAAYIHLDALWLSNKPIAWKDCRISDRLPSVRGSCAPRSGPGSCLLLAQSVSALSSGLGLLSNEERAPLLRHKFC